MSALSSRISKPLRHLSVALACVLAGVVQAEPAPALAGHDNEHQVLPILNTRSGRVEALLLLSSDQDNEKPLDRLFPREQANAGIGLAYKTKGGNRLSGVLQPDMNAGFALLCDQGIHVAMTLGTLSQECLLTQVARSTDDPLLSPARSPGVSLDTRWESPGGGMDLSFGLSWLETSLHGAGTSPSMSYNSTQYGLSSLPPIASTSFGDLSQRQVRLTGNFPIGQKNWLSVGGSMSTQELTLLAGQPLRWDTAAVTLGLGNRNISGFLTGRIIELPQGRGNLSDVDLGFSWRMPWQAELSFGAKNLLNHVPDTSAWPMNDLPALETPGGRTPYVRYKQDL